MIVGIGIDVVAVERARRLMKRFPDRFLVRCFADGEVLRAGDAEHVAGLLAAKEAAFKALGTGWAGGVGWTQVVVRRASGGRPTLELQGAAAERARALGATRLHLSLSHTHGLATAVVVMEASDAGA